jgi:hypothetical protein
MLSLLQAATAVATTSSAPPIGEWLAAIVGFLTVVSGAFKIGALAQRVSGFERDVVKKLDEFIASTNEARQSWAGWRATTDSRLGRVEQDQTADKEARHDLRESVNTILSDHEKRIGIIEGDRRNGPADRRHES